MNSAGEMYLNADDWNDGGAVSSVNRLLGCILSGDSSIAAEQTNTCGEAVVYIRRGGTLSDFNLLVALNLKRHEDAIFLDRLSRRFMFIAEDLE